MREVSETAMGATRVGHLLRITGYLEIAIICMWLHNPHVLATMGMVEASLRGEGPGGKDEDLFNKLRALVEEARDYYVGDDFPAAMARMRVAQDLVDLRIVAIGGG